MICQLLPINLIYHADMRQFGAHIITSNGAHTAFANTVPEALLRLATLLQNDTSSFYYEPMSEYASIWEKLVADGHNL